MKYCIGIDLGGTNIKAGVVSECGKVIYSQSVKTNMPRTAEEIMDDMADLCFAVAKACEIDFQDVCHIGVGTPGGVNSKDGIVLFSPNLAMKDVAMKEYLEAKLSKTISIANDANAAAVGEYLFGCGKDKSSMIMITLGTGIGGGIIQESKLLEGEQFCGGELGHMVISFDGRSCACGRKGCFERYASATGLAQTTKEYMLKNPDSKMWQDVENITEIDAKLAYKYKAIGDETATAVVEEYQAHLACGLANIINIFQPTIICLGGGVANEKETLLTPLKKLVEKESYDKNNYTQITTATLGYEAGIIGAAFLDKMK